MGKGSPMIVQKQLVKKMSEKDVYEVENVIRKGKKYFVTFSNLDDDIELYEDQLVEYRIIKGNTFTKSEIKQIKKSSELSSMYNKAIHFINYKLRTEKEVRDFLIGKEVPESDIHKIIQKLKAIDFINDKRFVTMYTDELIRRKKGHYGIRQALIQKGIAKELIDESLDTYLVDTEKQNALDVATKALKQYTTYPVKKQKLQVMQKLISLGFSQDIINQVMNQLEYATDFTERLEAEYQKLVLKEEPKEKIITKLLAKGYEYSDIKKIMKS